VFVTNNGGTGGDYIFGNGAAITYPGRMVGYSGGIGPENVASVIERIAADGPYWIDMESKVRTDDWFDLSLCREVCEIVYDGVPP